MEMLREDHGIFHPVYQRVGSPKDGSIFKTMMAKDFDPGTAWRCNMRVALACLLGIELWNQVGLPENKGLHTKNPMVYHHFPRSKLEKEMGVNPPMFRSHLLNSWLPVKCI